jgi:hypothetical protein
MPLQAKRVLKQFKYAMYFNGVNAYVVIPLTVYGWSGITIQEWIYPFHPKANREWSKSGMIGDVWNNSPSMFFDTDGAYDYTWFSSWFATSKPDATIRYYIFYFYTYKNVWFNVVRGFDLSSRTYKVFVNGGSVYTASIPSTEITVLEWNPATATNPYMYQRFVLGANVNGGENMMMMQSQLLIYSRALSDSEIQYNYNNPNNPITNGLVLWLQADPKYVSGNTWLDLSGYNNNGTIYGAQLVQLEKTPLR